MQHSMTDTLMRRISRRCEQEQLDLAGKTVLCALSGGRDSMTLLHLLMQLSRQVGFAVTAAHFNHHLRESAQRDEDFVTGHCRRLGVPLTVDGADVAAYARETGASPEDAARTLRYAFLRRAAAENGADYIATGHHRQDNAETLLLHLLRGSGLNGLGGIAFLRGDLLRPLLDVDRAEIDACVREESIPYVEDETNADPVYSRNRIRLELLPLLEELSPGSSGRIADTAVRLRADEEYLRQQADKQMGGDPTVLFCSLLRAQPRAIASRMVRTAAQHLGEELTGVQTEAVLNLRSGAVLALSGALRAERRGDTLRFYRLPPPPPPIRLHPGAQQWGEVRVTLRKTDEDIPEDPRTVVLRGDLPELTLAAWDGCGRLTVENGSRTVKRLFADSGIPPSRRENAPAIYTGGTLAAVFGAGTDFALKGTAAAPKFVITLDREA